MLGLLCWCVDWILDGSSEGEATALQCYRRLLMDLSTLLQHPPAMHDLLTGHVFEAQLLPMLARIQVGLAGEAHTKEACRLSKCSLAACTQDVCVAGWRCTLFSPPCLPSFRACLASKAHTHTHARTCGHLMSSELCARWCLVSAGWVPGQCGVWVAC